MRVKEHWHYAGPVVPDWAFWTVVVLVAVGAGLAIGYVDQPGEVARLEFTPRPNESSTSPAPAAAAEMGGVDQSHLAASPLTGNKGSPRDQASALVTRGVTVQVLNATKARRADNRAAQQLRSLGLRVVAVNDAVKIYDKTTVFWSKPAGREAARALADRFSWKADRRPRNLNPKITIHVVVGRDEV
jgi:hypothetical protein